MRLLISGLALFLAACALGQNTASTLSKASEPYRFRAEVGDAAIQHLLQIRLVIPTQAYGPVADHPTRDAISKLGRMEKAVIIYAA